ncbi:hypothetical protein TWF696_006582 [Orbilia brochopaga]|uniref:N-acetyltransferase domain-containing protein n=1 Tax=Orbilia brochopaga TaxID=3140254 RepID=A0AAV9V3B4_9PEZI
MPELSPLPLSHPSPPRARHSSSSASDSCTDTNTRPGSSSSPTALPISSLPPNVTIRAPTKANIHLLKRINSLLLPVPYPENFYRDVLQRPESEILTRLAFYDDECVGGIRCRVETEAEYRAGLERFSLSEDKGGPSGSKILQAVPGDSFRRPFHQRANGAESESESKRKIYIMTLAVLAPYRSLSIGSHLVNYILATAAKDPSIDADEAYAHVWVANEGAFEFYRKLGFDVSNGAVVRDYYRRLDPRDAKVVSRRIQDT